VIDRYTLSDRSDAKKVSLVRGSAREAQVALSSLGLGLESLLLTFSWQSVNVQPSQIETHHIHLFISPDSLTRGDTSGPRWCNGRGV
jgi:hypothetical protein